uniref:VWFA domain-containing protein n=1 Tax=Esox lucius TaxID=8010 RepID=A0A3P8YEF3_ESOLU
YRLLFLFFWLTITLLKCVCLHFFCHLISDCSTASNDLVYIMDGSSSVGTPDFNLAKRWLVNITSGFQVSSRHTQVGVVQYSDTPRLEIPLGKHLSSPELVGAINAISYLGGNTQTGRAIKFATQHVFPSSTRTHPARNRIAVVLTDGRSQDDVVDAAVEAKAQNIILFAVGVGNEILNSELVSMANEPPSTYVLYAEGYSSISNIQDAMQQKLCQESVCPLQIPGTANVKGFELLSRMQIDIKSKKVQGSLMSETRIKSLLCLSRDIFPDGLPPSFVFVATVRLKSPTNHVKFDLIRVLSLDGRKQFAVTLNGLGKSVTFTSTTSTINKEDQSVIFNDRGIKRLFDSRWHQVKLLVKPRRIVCYLDNMQIEEQLLEPVVPIYIQGKTQVAKKFKMEATVPIEIQKLRLYCDPEQSDKEMACEINFTLFLTNNSIVVQGKPGERGTPGEPGKEGNKVSESMSLQFQHLVDYSCCHCLKYWFYYSM